MITESSPQSSNSAYIGITVSEITEEASRLYNMPYVLYVSSVVEGSPAESAGLQVGDIISAIDGEDITTYDELAEYIATKSPGDSATITLYRTSNGVYREGTVTVVLGENENASQ